MSNDRRDWIGGSDIASIMGVGWKTPLQIWAEKTGKVEPEDLSDNELVQAGIDMEEFIAQQFQKKTGKKVRRLPENFRYTHKKYPFIRCQVDRILEGLDENLECKNTSEYRKEEWVGENMPAEVICQCQWGLGITGRKRGWVAAWIGGNRLRYKEIIFDQQFFDNMVTQAVIFWERFVLADVAPMAMTGDEDLIVDLNPGKNTTEIELGDDWDTAIARHQELAGQIKVLEEEKADIKARIMQVVGENTGVRTARYFVKRIDVKACEYIVKKEASWYPRCYSNKEKKA